MECPCDQTGDVVGGVGEGSGEVGRGWRWDEAFEEGGEVRVGRG